MSISSEALLVDIYAAFNLVFYIITFAIMKIAKKIPIIGWIGHDYINMDMYWPAVRKICAFILRISVLIVDEIVH